MTCALQVLREDLFGIRSRPRRDPESVVRLRQERLRRVVLHAARNVPHYRRLFAEAKLDPREIRGVRDLALLPPSSRGTLQGVPLIERVARGVHPERLVRHATSGSTGEPRSFCAPASKKPSSRAISFVRSS